MQAEEKSLQVPLKDGDIISVTGIQELEPKTVLVEGEVRFPGAYAVRKGDRAYDIIKRAGGYTESAYPLGIIFTRERVAKKEKSYFS